MDGTNVKVELPEFEVLHVPDEFEYLDAELIEILTKRISSTLDVVCKI